MAIYALHGFLGTPKDWSGLLPSDRNVHAPNLFETTPLPFWEWAESFNDKVKGSGNTLIGYSMGGRLVLHALILNPSLWKSAIIISANPGIEKEGERIERLQADSKWRDKFLNDPWDEVMEAWNRQPIFNGDPLHRREQDFSRMALAQALLSWSVGKQEFLKPRIEALDLPILWIAGEWDQKYVAIAKSLKLKNSRSKISIAPQAGHRVPWHQKLWFQKEVEQFL